MEVEEKARRSAHGPCPVNDILSPPHNFFFCIVKFAKCPKPHPMESLASRYLFCWHPGLFFVNQRYSTLATAAKVILESEIQMHVVDLDVD